MADIKTASFKDVLGKSECYLGNLAELAARLDDVTVTDEDGKIILDLKGTVAVINTVWSQVKETVKECEGKDLEVNLPDGIIGNILAAALGVIGIQL